MVKHLILQTLQEIAQYAGALLIASAIPYAISALKKAKLKTQSKFVADVYSIGETVIIGLAPEVEIMKKDGKFTKEEATKIKQKAIKLIKENIDKNKMKMLRHLIGNNLVDNFFGNMVEHILAKNKHLVTGKLPDSFAGFHFNWKF